ncbi:MAG: type IV pilus modification protein PilV [Woeseiaceae bacterium]|nr:type IV pilus modification protein PilV [Woeseiaceae bacterium]
MQTHNQIRNRQKGFSLVEVLIALIIMSVGMLGIASLFVNSMQAGRTSMFRHHAVTLAGDVADRIRANPRAGVAYVAKPGADNNCVDGGVDCTEAQMAMNDIFLWQQQAANTLPGGDVTILFDNAVSPPIYTITVSWNEPGEVLSYQIIIPVLGI